MWDGTSGSWDYYLEGSRRNWDGRIYALLGAMAALDDGAYFVSDGDNDFVLDVLCRQLALRRVTCEGAASGDIPAR